MTLASEKDLELAISNGEEAPNEDVIALSINERSQLEAEEIEIERNVDSINNSFFKIGEALNRIKVERLYKEHGTFAEYMQSRWGWTSAQGYRLINAYKAWVGLPTDLRGLLKNTDAAAELNTVLPENWREVIMEEIRENGMEGTKPNISKIFRRMNGGSESDPPPKTKPTYYGEPINFRGLRHEPINENGVVFLFGLVAKDLGFSVELVQAGFPDCEAKMMVSKNKWTRVRIEFEYESRNFLYHGHDPNGCDMIICWRDNWPDRPPNLKVLELSSEIRTLALDA